LKGVLLLAHGTPDSLDEMPEYLTLVRGGRPPSDELLAEMRRNYAAIGGRSPLTDLTIAQADALRVELGGTPTYVGMRNWKPFVAEALAQAERDGVEGIVALPMAPQESGLSVGKYREAVERAAPDAMDVRFAMGWHAHPRIVAAFAEKLSEALSPGRRSVVFTAHSLPLRVIEKGDAYADHVSATAAAVAAQAGVADYRIAYQSAGRTPEPWLKPSLEETIAALASSGETRVLAAPIGFVCDHTEILYDVDVQARAVARERGVDLARTESLNTSPTFIRALAEVVRPLL
jgi:ferrochelatase